MHDNHHHNYVIDMAPLDDQVIAWTVACSPSSGLSLSLLMLFLCIILLSLCIPCNSHSTATGAQPCSPSVTQKVSTQQVSGPPASMSDENSVNAGKKRCSPTCDTPTKNDNPVRSLTVIHHHQTKTPTHTRGLSHGYFSQALPMPECNRFSQTFPSNMEILHYPSRDRIAPAFQPAHLSQIGHHMRGFEGTNSIIYNSTERETDAIPRYSASHIYSEPGLENEEAHLYACIGRTNTSDSPLSDSCLETDEASETGQEDEGDHTYECIRGTNDTNSQRPRPWTQTVEAEPEPEAHPYQMTHELSQAVSTAEPAVSQSGHTVLVPPTLSDTEDSDLIGTEVTAVYASINWKNKSRYRTAALPSTVLQESEKDEGADSEPLPPIPVKQFI